MNETRSIPIGAHLTSPRHGYTHHGIYAGGGRVLHYAGFSRALRRGPVVETTIDQFARGRSWTVQPRVAPRFAGAAAVERGRTRLGESRYRFWTNNCEHFVEWCIEGRGRSHQVEQWRSALRGKLQFARGLPGRGAFDAGPHQPAR